MKIFISYSRRDADYAQQIDEYFQGSGHNVFTDVEDIHVGVVWTSAIETNISNCDIFAVIITHASLRSIEVEKEVRQAQREKKTIIPCVHRDVSYDDIKWDLKSIQGVEFQDKYELSRDLYSKIAGTRKEPSSTPRYRDDYPSLLLFEKLSQINLKLSKFINSIKVLLPNDEYIKKMINSRYETKDLPLVMRKYFYKELKMESEFEEVIQSIMTLDEEKKIQI